MSGLAEFLSKHAWHNFLWHNFLDPVGFSMDEINDLVARTGGELSFTYSDISQRLLPAIVMAAFPTERISFKHALEALNSVQATPEFQSE